jgi:hypothetical protein
MFVSGRQDAKPEPVTWYEHAAAYAVVKWPPL